MHRFCIRSDKHLSLMALMILIMLNNSVWANNRVALVIGNSDYGYDSLKNPVNDAKAIRDVLSAIGFNVITALNTNKSRLDSVLYEFGEAAEIADIAIIYYAGHAIEVDGRNYMMPTGVSLKKRRDLKKLTDMQEFVEEASLAKSLGLVIIDACRDNPFATTLQSTLGRSVGGRGLARINTGTGNNTLVAFATEAGQIAQDGRGKNSPYAQALVNNLSRKNVDVRLMFGQVRDDVMAKTRQSQQPYTYGSLSGQAIYLATDGAELSQGNSSSLKPATGRLTIKVEPRDAKIRIMNIGPKYQAGMRLAINNSYDVYVTRKGYKPYRSSVQLNEAEQVVGIVLESVSTPVKPVLKPRQWYEPEMVAIPAGSYRMGDLSGEGDDDEKPVHKVSLSSFMLSRYEVTVGQFKAFVESSGYKTDAEKNAGAKSGCRTWEEGEWVWREGRNWRGPGFDQSDRHPVVCVSWRDSKAYINWLNMQTEGRYRLPSESEWEYAARAGSSDKYSFGNDADQLCEHGNVADKTKSSRNTSWKNKADCNDGYYFTAPVGTHAVNEFGVNDLHGNVWEWLEDRWHESYKGAPSDGGAWLSGDSSHRVLRGGAWVDRPAWVRSANRFRDISDYRFSFIGFRLAQDR